ncbi:MAG: ribosome recycling factor [Flavobacteriales bacterium]|nr:ribosome recycling factor [Flavobacteriales bacterium]MCX7649525.1 ribosome recycling factor [Flavobacteriales bacterium]MDW8431238.1 ribosome recycling factor [Flavobacteriales bacterium]
MDTRSILEEARQHMEKALDHLQKELVRVRTGKANPALLEGVMVEAYGTLMALNTVAGISVQDSRTLLIQPWDKSLIKPIETAIQAANLGLNPGNDGDLIRIIMPPLTEERRKELVKTARHMGEEAKVSIRNARRDANEKIKKLTREGLSEDEAKAGEEDLQHLTQKFSARVDDIISIKEKEILTV